MKKIVVLFMLLFILSFSVFAKWSIGQVVDDFDDPTGEEFVYTLTEGSFSNSATSNAKSCIRILSQFSVSPYPSERWTFEIHDYSWDNPIDDYYDDSVATIKIKDEKGQVTTFSSSNSKYSHTWNRLKAVDGYKFTQLLKDNDSLKVSVSIERSKYVFTIDCSDFNEIFDRAISKLETKIGYWYYEELSDSTIELYNYLLDMYKSIGEEKEYSLGSYCLYDEQSVNGELYLFYFNIDNNDYIKNKYISVDFSLSSVDKSLSTPVTTDIKSSEVKEIYFVAGSFQKKVQISDESVYTWSASESIQDIVDKMGARTLSGAKVLSGIKVVLKNGKTILLEFDGQEFESYYSKAKSIPQLKR